MSSRSSDLRLELSYLRENLVEAAQSGRTVLLEEGLEAYGVIVNEFLGVLAGFGGTYQRAEATAELTSIRGGWREIEWVREDYGEIATAALKSDNRDVIFLVAHFPIKLARLAFNKRDYFVFAQFLQWLPFLYAESVERHPQSREGELLRERLSSYLRDTRQYFIMPALETASELGIDQVAEFIAGIDDSYNALLKRALDLGRLPDFEAFLRDFLDAEVPPGIDDGVRVDEEEADGPTAGTALRAVKELAKRRRFILLGLDAWLLREIAGDRPRAADIPAWHQAIALPSGLRGLWRLYLGASDREVEQELGWRWWEANEHHGRGVFAGMDFGLLLLRPVLVRMARAAAGMSPESLRDFQLPLDRRLDYLVGRGGGDGPLIQTLRDLATEDRWHVLLSDQERAALLSLEPMFRDAARRQRDVERDAVIAAPIVDARVADFRKRVYEGWETGCFAKRLFEGFGSYEEVSDQTETEPVAEPAADGGEVAEPPEDAEVAEPAAAESQELIVDRLDPKDLFTEESRYASIGWGLDYGRSLAQGEDEAVLEALIEAVLPEQRRALVAGGMAEGATSALRDLGEHAKRPTIVIINSWDAISEFLTSGRYRISHGAGGTGPAGHFDGVPVYQSYSHDVEAVLIADLARFATLRQFAPEAADADDVLVRNVIRAWIENLSAKPHERANLLARQGFLADTPAEERDAVLSELVRVRLRIKFGVEVKAPEAALLLTRTTD